jgi:hypothetical protein
MHAEAEPLAGGLGGRVAPYLPRAAALGVVIGIVAIAVSCWPQIRGGFSGTVEPVGNPGATSQPAEITATLIVPERAATPGSSRPPVTASGWIAVRSPFEVRISEGGQVIAVDNQGRAQVLPGEHLLRFQNLELGYDETRTVQVRATETTPVNLVAETTIAVTSSSAAEVQIDGARAGDTPYEGTIGVGTHTVTVKAALGAERQFTINATSKPVQLEVDFLKP